MQPSTMGAFYTEVTRDEGKTKGGNKMYRG